MDEERLVNIELKLAAMEDLLDELNKTVYAQQKHIDSLETLATTLARQLRDGQAGSGPGGEGMAANEKPPHY